MYTHKIGGKHKMYTQEVRGDKRRTLKKYEETQDVRPRIRGKHKTYAHGVGGYSRRTLKTYGETQDIHSRGRGNARRTLKK